MPTHPAFGKDEEGAGSGSGAVERLGALVSGFTLVGLEFRQPGEASPSPPDGRWPELPVLTLTLPERVGARTAMCAEHAVGAASQGRGRPNLVLLDTAGQVRSEMACPVLERVSRDELERCVRELVDERGHLPPEIACPVLEHVEAELEASGSGPRIGRREREVLGLIADGLPNKQIARRLGLSDATVKGYVRQLFDKLGVTDRAQAVAVAMRAGIIR